MKKFQTTPANVERILKAEKILGLSQQASFDDRVVAKTDLQAIGKKHYGTKSAFAFLTKNTAARAARGDYILPIVEAGVLYLPSASVAKAKPAKKAVATAVASTHSPQAAVIPLRPDVHVAAEQQPSLRVVADNIVSAIPENVSFVPTTASDFVPFGVYDLVEKIIASKRFFPVYVVGLSGNGKTFMIEQACARHERELIRVNVTIETDESDLLGGWTLVGGDTKFQYGPVVEAMQRGAVLLLDEYDLGREKMMALQPVMEGNPIYLKKVNKWIYPAAGFTVVATANTKGRGESDSFVGAGVINEAALDRFKITLAHDYPDEKTELKILKKNADVLGIDKDDPILAALTKWAAANRQTFKDGGISEVITTRRLVAALELYGIIGDISKSVEAVCERFNEDDKNAMVHLFNMLSGKEDA